MYTHPLLTLHRLFQSTNLHRLQSIASLSKVVRMGVCRPYRLPPLRMSVAAGLAMVVVAAAAAEESWTIMPDKTGTVPPVSVERRGEAWERT